MKPFWATISVLSIFAFFLPALASVAYPPILPFKLLCYTSAGLFVAIIWAIVFRAQVETFRISLTGMFVLILLEAILLLAIRIAQPPWMF